LAGVAVVAVAIGFAEREGSNIVVDVVANRLAPRTRALTDAFTLLLSAGAIAFMFWAAVSDAFDSLTVRETTLTTGVLAAPFKMAWAVGVAILWLFLVQHMIEAVRKRRKG
jgi:TRAP-type C4-dicarboxylate transport system permease small subunit